MGEDSIKLGAGTLYINGEIFADVKEIEAFTETAKEAVALNPALSLASLEVAFTAVARVSKDLINALLGVTKAVRDLCQNNRVTRLAYHAKKYRTRKKNLHRMYREVEKEERKHDQRTASGIQAHPRGAGQSGRYDRGS